MPDGHRWNGYSHEELYQQINAGPGPKASHASMERWQGVSTALTEINAELLKGVQKSGALWEGAAADKARAGLNPLAAWADDARAGAEVMRVSAELQADFISKARSDMPAPVKVSAEDPGAILSALTHLVGGQTDYEQQEKAHSAAETRAREVMATYASSTTTNTSTLGQFHQPPQLVINATQTSVPETGGISAGPGGGYGVVGRGGGVGGGVRVPAQGTRAATSTPPTTNNTAATRTSSAPTSPSANSATTRTTVGGTSTPMGATGGSGVIGGRPAGKKTGSGSDETHAEAAGKGKQAAPGVTVASGAEYGPVAAPAPHAATPAAHGATAGTPAAAPHDNDTVHRRSGPMVPAQSSFDPFGGLGGRADDEEDDEHDAADYLRETDDIYGIGGMISPPVIGENQTH
jgi:hypothetical protein